MPYNNQVLNHYGNPCNVGSFRKGDDTVGTGMVDTPIRDNVMKLQIKVDEQGVTENAEFKIYGCGSAIASSSSVTEWVKGKALGQTPEVRNTAIVEELALSPVKTHCPILTEDTTRATVVDYRKKHGLAEQRAA